MFGWKTEEVLGRDIREVLKSADALQEMRTGDSAGDHSRTELAVVRKDGTPITIERPT